MVAEFSLVEYIVNPLAFDYRIVSAVEIGRISLPIMAGIKSGRDIEDAVIGVIQFLIGIDLLIENAVNGECHTGSLTITHLVEMDRGFFTTHPTTGYQVGRKRHEPTVGVVIGSAGLGQTPVKPLSKSMRTATVTAGLPLRRRSSTASSTTFVSQPPTFTAEVAQRLTSLTRQPVRF